MSKWIDSSDTGFSVGTIGYLVETDNTSNGVTTFSLRERPLRTNQSHEARLTGWCGETDNKSRHARGVWKIVRLNNAGDRAQIVELKGADLAAFLEQDGYPQLIPSSAA